MPKRRWLNAKESLAGKEIGQYFKERSRGKSLRLNQLFRQIQDKRGQITEDKVNQMLMHLRDRGFIKAFHWAQKNSWLDSVLKIDKILQRKDGAMVPIQVKTSYSGLLEFERKYAVKMKKRFGAVPVIINIRSDDGWEEKVEELLKNVDEWHGSFSFELWQLKYNQFLDFAQLKKTLGKSLYKRIRAVLRERFGI